MSNLTIDAWPVTDSGDAGQPNEDHVLVHIPEDPDVRRLSGSVYIVADGTSPLASKYAAERVMHSYYENSEPDLGLRLKQAIQRANADLYEYARQRPDVVNFTTTLTAVALRGELLHVANVGGSRAYLVRDQALTQITKDHSLVQQLIDEGALEPEEAAEHPRREVLLRTLGAEPEVAVDVFDVRLRPDDVFLLATDGLTNNMRDEDIAHVAATSNPRDAAQKLLERAKLKSEDDVTVIAALARGGGPPLNTNVPHRWDGTPATFELGGAGQETAAGAPVEQQPSGDEPVKRPLPQDLQAPPEQAPPYQQQEAPAPPPEQTQVPQQTQQTQRPPAQQGQRPSTQQGQRPPTQQGYQPPPGYQPAGAEVDPVTGLPPAPPPQQQPYQQYQQQGAPPPQQYGPPQGYQQQQGNNPYPNYGPRGYDPNQNQGGGFPWAAFLAAGFMGILVVLGGVFFLLDPLDLFPSVIGGADAPAAETTATQDPFVEPTTAPTDFPTPTMGEAPTTPPENGGGQNGGVPNPTAAPTVREGMILIASPDGSGLESVPRGATPEEVQTAISLCTSELGADNDLCLPAFYEDAYFNPGEDQFQQTITLSPFLIDEYEVTTAQYTQCVDEGRCTPPTNRRFYDDPNYNNHPVVYVTWDQATAYCSYVGKELPTEAQWEIAARYDPAVGEAYIWPWGDDFRPGVANLLAAGRGGTSPIDDFPLDISPFGVFDMAGNVTEWTADWYSPGYADRRGRDPVGPTGAQFDEPLRVAKGGSYLETGARARPAHRYDVNEGSSQPWLGFRCAAAPGTSDPVSPTEAPQETPVPTPTGATPAPTEEQ